jgi:hypothetical protein
VQGLGLRACEEELVDETAAGVEAQTAVRGETYLSVVALLRWQAGQDLPIGAGHQDGEGLLVSDAAEGFGGSVHCLW